MVLVGDKHRHAAGPRDVIPGVVCAGAAGNGFHAAGHAQAQKLGLHRRRARRQRIRLCLHAAGGGAAVPAPPIQHFGNVRHLLGALRQAQDQVEILRAVKFRAFAAARRRQQRTAEYGQMRDVIAAAQRVGGKVRLEMVFAQLFQRGIQHDLIRINKVRPLLVDGFHRLVQRIGSEHVVVVQQSDILSLCRRKGRVGVFGNAAVFGKADITHARVPHGTHSLFHLTVGRVGCVRQHQLQAGVGLAQHAPHHFAQKFGRRIVQRHHHRHKRHAGKARRALGLKLPAQRDVGAETPHLALCHQADAERRLAPQRLGAALPQAGGGAAGKACKMSRARRAAQSFCKGIVLRRVFGGIFFWHTAYPFPVSSKTDRTIYTLSFRHCAAMALRHVSQKSHCAVGVGIVRYRLMTRRGPGGCAGPAARAGRREPRR